MAIAFFTAFLATYLLAGIGFYKSMILGAREIGQEPSMDRLIILLWPLVVATVLFSDDDELGKR